MWDWKKKNNVDCISNSLCCSHRWWTKFLILKFVCTRVNAWNNPQQQEFVWVFQLNLWVEKQAKASNEPTNQPTNYQLLLPHPCHAMPCQALLMPCHTMPSHFIAFDLNAMHCTLYIVRCTLANKFVQPIHKSVTKIIWIFILWNAIATMQRHTIPSLTQHVQHQLNPFRSTLLWQNILVPFSNG